jgi:hypothetical protein
VPVVPARLCPLPSALYAVLLGYKESPVAEERWHLGAVVRALCRQFLADAETHFRAAADGAVDVVVPVPSTTRAGLSPLARVAGLGGEVTGAVPGAAWAPSALRRARPGGAPPLAHMRPQARGFTVQDGSVAVEGRRVLLLDDLYVSGSRAQSAAATLRLAGARAVVVAPLGRVLRPGRVPAHRAFLVRQARRACEASAGAGQFSGA